VRWRLDAVIMDAVIRALVVAVLIMAVVRADAERPTPRITIDYAAPTSAHVKGIPGDHVARVRALVELLESQVRLPNALKIEYRECGDAKAYYRRTSSTIVICHELWEKRRALYLDTGTDRETADRRLHNAMMFSVFHEIGHAFHDQFQLPLLGNEEDAIDDIATLWMIRLGAGEAAKSAAYGHHLRGIQPQYDNVPWEEHNNAGKRGFSIACMLYGSDPERYSHVFKQMNVPALPITRCKEEYVESHRAFHALFGPHLTR
jgi:hypothetical protein